MSLRSVRYARAAMAAPAILLLAIMGLAIAFSNRDKDGSDSDIGHDLIRGSSVNEDEPDDSEITDGSEDENIISLERHHGHSHGHNGPSKPQSDNTKMNDSSFDSYIYSMSYQPEFCRENNEKFDGCQNFMEIWEGQLTIHGLWPNRNDGSWPQTCSDEQFNLSLLDDLSDELEQNWPNVKALKPGSRSHESFWSHEWSKHGTCSGLNQHDYFAMALHLLLPTPPIVKDNYGAVVKRKELEEGYDGSDMAVFACKYGYLSEVRLCFEKMEDGTVGDRVACPASNLKQDSCGDEIKIASFDTRQHSVIA